MINKYKNLGVLNMKIINQLKGFAKVMPGVWKFMTDKNPDTDLNTVNKQILWSLDYLNSDLVTAFSSFMDDIQNDSGSRYSGFTDKMKVKTVARVKQQGSIPVNLAPDFRDYLADAVQDLTNDYGVDNK